MGLLDRPSSLVSRTLTPVFLPAMFVLFCAILLSACGGGPTGPSSPAAPSSSALTISPSSVTMSVGQSVVFTASGGDGYNYVFTPVWPYYAFDTTWISSKQIRVTMFNRSDVNPARVDLDGYVPGVGVSTVTAIINVR